MLPLRVGERREAEDGAGTDRSFRDGVAAALALVVLVLAAYHRIVFLGETFVARDALTFTWPSREFLGGSLRAGRIPEWSDWIGFGAPFAANPIHGVTYPPLWLVGILPPLLASDLVSVVHVVVAAIGAALLAGRFGAGVLGCVLAGAVYALGGYAVTVVPNGMAIPLAWLPWIAWAADRLASSESTRRAAPRALALAALLSLQALAGEPAQLATAGLMALIVILVRADRTLRALAYLGMAALVALPLSAVVLLPGTSLLAWSDRAAGLLAAYHSVWTLHPLRLVELIWPEFLGARNVPFLDLGRIFANTSRGIVSSPSWSRSLFVGAPALLLAVHAARSGRRELRLLVASLLFLLLAFGNSTPAHALLRWLPLFGWARYPEKYVDGTLLILAVLAGAGFTRAFRESARSRLLFISAAVTGATGVLLVAAYALRAPILESIHLAMSASPFPYEPERAVAVSLSSGTVAWIATALFTAALALRPRRAAAVAAALVVLASLVWHEQAVMRTAPRDLLDAPPQLLAPLAHDPFQSASPRPRLTVMRGTDMAPKILYETPEAFASVLHEHLSDDVAARFGFEVVPGFDSITSAPLSRLRSLVEQARATMTPGGLARVGGVEYALVPRPQMTSYDGSHAIAQGELVALLATPARPRAFVAPRWAWRSADAALLADARAIAGAAPFDPGHVYLEGSGDDSDPLRSAEPLSPCQVETHRPEEVHLSCSSRLGGYAVLLDAPAPGWTARVDGQPADIKVADGLFRAVAVSSGSHEVTFTYQTPGLRRGALVSLVSWIACGIALAVLYGTGASRHTGSSSSTKANPSSPSASA